MALYLVHMPLAWDVQFKVDSLLATELASIPISRPVFEPESPQGAADSQLELERAPSLPFAEPRT